MADLQDGGGRARRDSAEAGEEQSGGGSTPGTTTAVFPSSAWRHGPAPATVLEMTPFLAFLGVSLIVIVTPGPDTAMTIRNTLVGGRLGGVFTALGIASGQLVWALATSIGIVALLIASAPLFAAVKYAGAAYLV